MTAAQAQTSRLKMQWSTRSKKWRYTGSQLISSDSKTRSGGTAGTTTFWAKHWSMSPQSKKYRLSIYR